MKSFLTILSLLLALFAQTAGAQEPRFAPGHTFQMRVTGVPQEETMQVSSAYTISSEGTVKLPHIAEISAAGLTPTELQRRIQRAYVDAEIYTHPTVTINVNSQAQIEQVVTVGGEVRQPGDFPFRPGINLYSAIMKAGGPTEFAEMKKVKLIRGKSERVIDLRKVTQENNPDLQAGDQIVVPQG